MIHKSQFPHQARWFKHSSFFYSEYTCIKFRPVITDYGPCRFFSPFTRQYVYITFDQDAFLQYAFQFAIYYLPTFCRYTV